MRSQGNLATSLRRRARPDTMHAYDALPAGARRWLAGASLPWSARSVGRLWAQAWREAGGDLAAVQARMDAAEARKLARDAAGVWGAHYPVNPKAPSIRPQHLARGIPFWQMIGHKAAQSAPRG